MAGLRVWDEQGRKMLDTSSYTSRILGVVTLTHEVAQTVLNFPVFGNQRRFWFTVNDAGLYIVETATGIEYGSVNYDNRAYAVPVYLYYGVF